MSKLIPKLFTIAMLFCLSSCTSHEAPIEDTTQLGRIDPTLLNKYTKPSDAVEEYINRIGKKILVVSAHPGMNFQFKSISAADQILELDQASNTVALSHGLLKNLKDEAELAAILTLSMEKLAHSNDIDQDTIKYLFRAGYDPQALIDLQQNQAEFLQVIYTTSPSADIIEKNKDTVSRVPLGLKRGAEEYSKQMEHVY